MACQPAAVGVAEVEPADMAVVVDSAAEAEGTQAAKACRTGSVHVLEAWRCSDSRASSADCLDLSSLLDNQGDSLEVVRSQPEHCTLLGTVRNSEDMQQVEHHTVQA